MEVIDHPAMASVRIKRTSGNEVNDTADILAVEEPLAIHLQYHHGGAPIIKQLAVTMRTPGYDDELALGFLFTEGIINGAGQVQDIRSQGENTVVVTLASAVSPSLQGTDRNFYTTSSCGVCGKSSIDAIKTSSSYQAVTDSTIIPVSMVHQLPAQVRATQGVFDCTGALHASALFDLEANLILLREDVGRHNALDKLIGATLRARSYPLSDTILLLSGRASFELIQKASMSGIRIVAAIGAPSSLAVQLAHEFNMTLIGFVREDRFNIYSGAHRISEAR